jgi:CheY-like chemotaxis protein/DNA-binding MarR family transcriptional regulator
LTLRTVCLLAGKARTLRAGESAATEIEVQPTDNHTLVEPTRTRVLVVDDDPAMLQLVHAVLQANGYSCLMAASAEQALAILSATPDIPIAISDISMPGMDGLVFLERINSRGDASPPPRVIFLTAHPRLDFAVAALRLGAVDFLTKPVRPRELLQAVKNAVERVERAQIASQSQDHIRSLAQQAEAFAAALKGWAPLQPQDGPGIPAAMPAPSKRGIDHAHEFALLGMDQVRRLRRSFPPLSELDDVAWHLLLDLARAEKSSQRLSVSALCVSVEHVSSTTALRRVQELVKAGHIVRVPDAADARRDFVVLDATTHAILDQYLDRVAADLAAAARAA